MTLCLVFRSISSTAPPEQTAYEELAAIETMSENVRQLENETLIQNEALSRIENLSEDLLTRILRLEAANNGTQGTTQYNRITAERNEVTTQASPPVTTQVEAGCCDRIRLISKGSMTRDPKVSTFIGVYDYKVIAGDRFAYMMTSHTDNVISNSCEDENDTLGFMYERDYNVCNWNLVSFMGGSFSSCITGPSTFTVRHYTEASDGRDWVVDDTVLIACVE